MYEETSKPLVRRTRHTLRSAEFGFSYQRSVNIDEHNVHKEERLID
jgi:hypothetical protein